MNLNDILVWISRNGVAAFLIGCFLITLAGLTANFLIGLMRAITGNYPAASVSRYCDADDPCYCCRSGECDPGCRCSEEEDEA